MMIMMIMKSMIRKFDDDDDNYDSVRFEYFSHMGMLAMITRGLSCQIA